MTYDLPSDATPPSTPAYCVLNNGDCETCSLVNYGRNCMNHPIHRPDTFETIIMVQVPHQREVFACAIETESQLREMADLSVGDNYEFPGHYENPDNEDDPGDWIDETTVEDLKEAIAHDMHCAYFITKEDYLDPDGWSPGSHHQAIAVRNAVDRIAVDLGWKEGD